MNKPEETFRVNLGGTKRVLDCCVDAGVKKFLFPSTTSVYGETEGLVDETFNDHKPATPYAESKLAAEKVIQEYGKSKGIETKVLRMGTIFGTSEGMRFHTAVNKFCYLASLNKPITVWDAAYEQYRPYLGLDDCVRAFQFLEQNGKSGEVYNVVTKNYTVKDVLDSIKKYKPDVKMEITKAPIINQKSYKVSNSKIREEGFVFHASLDKSLKETLKLFDSIKNY
jgi:nucleoside-diphosphate-sugar epimerase